MRHAGNATTAGPGGAQPPRRCGAPPRGRGLHRAAVAVAAALGLAAGAAGAAGCGVPARDHKSVAERQSEQMQKLLRRQETSIARARSEGEAADAHGDEFRWPDPQPERDVAVLQVAGRGEIRIALYPEIAPRTVERFEELVKQGFYDGTTFHRVVRDFVVQGGDPLSKNDDPRDDGMGGSGHLLPDEFSDAPHDRGVVSMANRAQVKTADSQFFITVADHRELDGRYAVFGRVVAGMDVVDAISRVEVDRFGRHGPTNRPLEDVVVERVTLERASPAALAAAEATRKAHARSGAHDDAG